MRAQIVVPISDIEDMYRISLREHAKEWERLKNKMTAIDRWDVFGPTYPCMPRERIGSVTDGGKWCALGRVPAARDAPTHLTRRLCRRQRVSLQPLTGVGGQPHRSTLLAAHMPVAIQKPALLCG